MEHPIQNLCGHLLFSRDGTVWATWRLQGQAYGRRAVAEKEQIRVLHQMLYRSLGGESLHMGFEVDTDPVQVIRDMLRGLNHPLEDLPEWAAEVERIVCGEHLGGVVAIHGFEGPAYRATAPL